uniref:Uncharacterized protein n=1 Tax=Anguilla anguilla TaxID=7936 RepID=A0A0E9THG2_ANGAN
MPDKSEANGKLCLLGPWGMGKKLGLLTQKV